MRKPKDVEKWTFLREAPHRDASTPEIVTLAQHLNEVARRSPWRDFAFANLAMCVARDLIVYQLDGERFGREHIFGFTDPQGPADEALRVGIDDCDAKARLFVAICLAGGLRASMQDRWNAEGELSHVYGGVLLVGPREQTARWWLAETILRRARLGEIAEAVPKEQETGAWLF